MILKELEDTSSYKLAKVTYMQTYTSLKNSITDILFLNSDGHQLAKRYKKSIFVSIFYLMKYNPIKTYIKNLLNLDCFYQAANQTWRQIDPGVHEL